MPTITTRPPQGKRPFLAKLRSDTSANVLMITALAVIPVIGVVGGAIDASRMYLTYSRIQAACDSAVLAGRKAMPAYEYTPAAKARANSMFAFNFQDADYGTEKTSFTSSADPQGKVTGNVTTSLPMTLMQIFNFGPQDLSVVCSADVQVPNIDIVFVLDVTGSMNSSLDGKVKLAAMKEAAKAFYVTMEEALQGNTQAQVRYGFVPYSQTINVSELFKSNPDAKRGELPLSHLANSMEVESRVANFHTAALGPWIPDPDVPATSFLQRFDRSVAITREPFQPSDSAGTKISTYDCDRYGENTSFNVQGIDLDVALFPRTTYNGEAQGDSLLFKEDGSNNWVTQRPTDSRGYTEISFSRHSPGWTNNGPSQYQLCQRRVTMQRYIRQPMWKFTSWTYKPVTFDVLDFKRKEPLSFVTSVDPNYLVSERATYDPVALRKLANQAGLGSSTIEWDGCIEERKTTAATNFAPVPAEARDLNYLEGGATDDMRWRTNLAQLTYDRQQVGQRTRSLSESQFDNPSYRCPSRSVRNLNEMTKSAFNAYIDSLEAGGNTYLDMGMVWGLRLIAQKGMFASRNQTGTNGNQISRHIIFLTDGEPVSALNNYSSYGTERMSRRIIGNTGVAQATLHSRRFQALCDAQRGNINIWAIAFGTSVTSHLSTCADPGRAKQANNQAELEEEFRRIARDIADLRLVQ